MNRRVLALLVSLVFATALTSVALAAHPNRVRVVPEHRVGPVSLGEPRSKVEAELGNGTAHGDWISSYRYRKATLLVSYTEKNLVREVSASGRGLRTYGQSLRDEQAAIPVLKSHGWTVEECGPYTFVDHAVGGRFSSVIWKQQKLQQAGVSTLGPMGFCPVGSPAEP